jgi:hypothetical protein
MNKARQIAYGLLTCLGRHTVTGMLASSGGQFVDWTSAYRLFNKERIDVGRFFTAALRETLNERPSSQGIVAHMDDTLIKKTGRKIPGTAWRRDPLGPPFHTNFIWGQRFLQISLALPDGEGPCQSRSVPVDFHHCPTLKKPGHKATEQEIQEYKKERKRVNLSMQGKERIKALRKNLDEQGHEKEELVISVDGSYTNGTVLKNLPPKTTLIGRIRKDVSLHSLPDQTTGAGRKRVYGEKLPTPEQIRQSDEYHWQKVEAWAAGRRHDFNVKVVKDAKWRKAGGMHTMQIVVIRPLSYRLTKSSKLLYREPAYLVCTDNGMDIKQLLQDYLWRWEIEVNFREEKTLLGCGQAQVRNEKSATVLPAFTVALYAFILLASRKIEKGAANKQMPRPKWYSMKKRTRTTASEIINRLRAELWAKAIGFNFSDFVKQQFKTKTLEKWDDSITHTFMYVRK